MFLKIKKKYTGKISVKVISKSSGKYKAVKTIGNNYNEQKIQELIYLGKQELEKLSKGSKLLIPKGNSIIKQVLSNISHADIRTVGPEIMFGKIYDNIGFGALKEYLFRHLVIARLAYTSNKINTVEYLYSSQGLMLDNDEINQFLDKLNSRLKEKIEKIVFAGRSPMKRDNIRILLYDVTSDHFEWGNEDKLNGKHINGDSKYLYPKYYVGLLVDSGGYVIGYDIFEGNINEGHNLIPFFEKISERCNLVKPIVIAKAGLLSDDNIISLEKNGYGYIVSARLKKEPEKLKKQILEKRVEDGQLMILNKQNDRRLIITFTTNQAIKDENKRKRDLQQLQKLVKIEKLSKSNNSLNGYNKYLRIAGEAIIEIDHEKFNNDKTWDGLKGYMTNTKIDDKKVVEDYKSLWHIGKAFRMSKTDLLTCPIYNMLKHKIEAHLCIAFTAYYIYKELERVLIKEKTTLSLRKSIELTHSLYQINYSHTQSRRPKSRILKMNEEQEKLYQIINKNFLGIPMPETEEHQSAII